MDYLQYNKTEFSLRIKNYVLNLIINGLPSIRNAVVGCGEVVDYASFKPYYKWITFNTPK